MSIDTIFNLRAFLLMLGGLASLVLTVVIKIATRLKRIADAKDTIEQAIQMEPLLRTKYGDIGQFLENDPATKNLNFWKELVVNSIQPLLLLSILTLLDIQSTIGVIFLLVLVIFSFAHEIFFGERNANETFYRVVIILLWILFYLISVYNYNRLESMKNINPFEIKTVGNQKARERNTCERTLQGTRY